ncbi:MAG: DNA sulfur modification protein DndD [Microcystaceae cyanobacterium]
MIFTELILENFGPYAGRHVLNLRPEQGDSLRPIILIGGMNGGGKTTLMDAIRLALYGQRAQCSTRNNLSYSDFLIQSINRHQTFPSDGTRVELEFEHIVEGQWKTLRVVRYWRHQLKEGKDTLGIIYENEVNEGLAATWDEYIEAILPLGISNLFLFDGEQVKELAEQDSPPPPVIEAIQSLLGLELAERLSTDLGVLLSRKRKALASHQDLETIETLEAKIEIYQQEADKYGQELKALQDKLEQAREIYQNALNKFKIEGGKIAADKSQLETQKQTLEETENKYRQELVILANSNLPLALVQPLLHKAYHQGQYEIQVEKAQAAKEILQQRDRQLLDYLPQIKLTSDQIQDISTFLQQENQKIYPTNTQQMLWLQIDEERLIQLDTLLAYQLKEQIEAAKKQLESLTKLEEELGKVQRQLTVAAAPEAYDALEKNLKMAQKTMNQCQITLENGQKRYQEATNNVEKTKKILEQFGEESMIQYNKEKLIQSILKAKQTIELFKERLTLKKLNKLESEVTECFRYLLHKSDLVHRVAIDTYDFQISLYSPQGKPVPKHRLSAGEKQLLAIAFLWGLARVSGRQLPIAIDTPLGRLDSSHRHHLVERYFPAASHQVILLSTDTEITETEVKNLREQEAIAREFLLKYNSETSQTVVGSDLYFW